MGDQLQEMAIELTDKEKQRGRSVFDMMDIDGGGTIDVQEICIVHESDKEAMIKILDADGNSEVDPAEWENYLYLKKQEKGKKKCASPQLQAQLCLGSGSSSTTLSRRCPRTYPRSRHSARIQE